MTDAPITPQNYLHGAKVVDIGDLRIARGMTRRPVSTCKHLRMVYDTQERRIYCEDCESDVDPFDAYLILVHEWDRAVSRLERERAELEAAKDHHVRSRAAKAMDDEWRRRNTVPACPHCKAGIFPEDVANGVGRTGKKLEQARRKREKDEYYDIDDAMAEQEGT